MTKNGLNFLPKSNRQIAVNLALTFLYFAQEPYKRTQLWRMTSSGILFNEGSSPPFDPRKPSSSSAGFVLDVGHADPMSFVKARKPLQLVVSKLSSQRKAYQTWSFTEVSEF